VGRLVPGRELRHPREQLTELQERLQELGRARADVVVVCVLEGYKRRDVVGVLDRVQPRRDLREVALVERRVPWHDVAREVDAQLSYARVGERVRFVVGKPKAKRRGDGTVGAGHTGGL